MPVVTLRPNGTAGTVGSPTIGGGAASHHDATSDNNDATYTHLPNPIDYVHHHVRYHMSDPAGIPPTAQIQSVTPRVRHNNNVGPFVATRYYGIGVVGMPDVRQAFPNVGSLATSTGSARTTTPNGTTWTAADLSNLQMIVNLYADGIGGTIDINELYLDVFYNETPAATGSALGNVTTSRPAFAWTYSDPEGDAQERYRVKVFSAAQYGAGGFDPNTSTPTADSGEVFSSVTSWTCTSDLTNGTTYRAFIFVSDVGSNGRYNLVTTAGPYSSATILIVPPTVPELTVAADPTNMRYTLVLQDRENILDAETANLEATLGTWAALSTCTVARTAYGSAESGAYVLDITSTGSASSMSAETGKFSVVPSQIYSARAAFHSVTLNRDYRVDIRWYDAANALISTSTGPQYAETGGVWVRGYATGTAPANAATASVAVYVFSPPSAGEHHYVDAVTLVPFGANMVDDPLFEVDSNADGIADNWVSYTTGAGTLTPAHDTSVVKGGIASQRIITTGNTGWKGVSQAGIPCKSGQVYTMSAWLYSSVPMMGDLYFDYAAAGSWSIPANTWTRVSATVTGVTTVINGTMYVRTSTLAGTLWIGHAQLELGPTATNPVGNRYTWARGGLLTAQRFEVQRSIDNGTTWSSVSRLMWQPDQIDYSEINISDLTQSMTTYDHEAQRNTAVMYRLRSRAVVGTDILTSQWSIWIAAGVLPVTDYWLKSPIKPSLNAVFDVQTPVETKRSETQQIFRPLGRSKAVVLHGDLYGEDGSLEIVCFSEAEFLAFEALRALQQTLLLQDPLGKQRYIDLGADLDVSAVYADTATRYRTLKISYVEVDSP